MRKKDQDIERLLDQYADREQPDMRLIYPAVQQMREQPKKKRSFKRMIPALATVLVLAIALSVFLPMILDGSADKSSSITSPEDTEPVFYYKLSDLSAKRIPADLLPTVAEGEVLPNIDTEFETEYTLFSFKESGNPAFISFRTRRIANTFTEDIVLVAELTDGICEEFLPFENLPAYKDGVRSDTVYENGEYITYAALSRQSVRYYLTVTRPQNTEIDAYLKWILEE